MIKQIMEAVSIPVMAKVRIGHVVEAQILQSIGVDYIDVSRESAFAVSRAPVARVRLAALASTCFWWG